MLYLINLNRGILPWNIQDNETKSVKLLFTCQSFLLLLRSISSSSLLSTVPITRQPRIISSHYRLVFQNIIYIEL